VLGLLSNAVFLVLLWLQNRPLTSLEAGDFQELTFVLPCVFSTRLLTTDGSLLF